jgi:hypothetical protein
MQAILPAIRNSLLKQGLSTNDSRDDVQCCSCGIQLDPGAVAENYLPLPIPPSHGTEFHKLWNGSAYFEHSAWSKRTLTGALASEAAL